MTLAARLTPILRGLDPETAHDLALRALALGLAGQDRAPDDPILATTALGLRFRNPIGLAAGFDKNARAILPLMRLGFGCIEAGTVTPQPQIGNPRPRIFRLAEDAAVINRLGFNNAGLAAFAARLAALPRPLPAVLGVNIGINKGSTTPAEDYAALTRALAPLAGYIVVNLSSPNTPGLRDLQGEAQLRTILHAVATARAEALRQPPILLKIAPDLADAALPPLIETCIAQGVAGLVVANSTITRPPDLRSRHAAEAGGLSGAPLFERATALLRRCFRLADGRLVLVGVGGVATPRQAITKIRAGASLIQLYSALAYAGPALIPRLRLGMAAELRAAGVGNIADLIGADA